jgi:uncharacterized SAM-binding protein YcdF (DUF218 family)
MGKPVISTDLPEIATFNIQNKDLVFVGRTKEEFMDCIEKALNTCQDKELIGQRISSAKKNSWSQRIEQMSDLVEEAINQRAKEPLDWKATFIRVYRNWRRRVSRVCLAALLAYLVLFYTPFVWWIAVPLRIAQDPQRADCIVVFAGGVGETGRAGQGYEERVKYAVELYKKGSADKIIFSSGSTYIFEETMIMKAVAISLGVSENSVILEDKAKSTYENVKYAKEILDKYGWDKILLVSSPYHMRRAALVFSKIAGNIKVTYTPIPNNRFYAHPDKDKQGRRIWKRINLQQIKGILHEYFGILYYWHKGYI